MNTYKLFSAFELEGLEELQAWRNNVIAKTFSTTTLIALPIITLWSIHYLRQNKNPYSIIAYALIYATIAGLAISRRPPPRAKAWALVFLIYLTGTIALILGGLVGDGRIYYMIVPTIAVLLININAGFVFLGLSVLTYFLISVAAHFGYLTPWILIKTNSLEAFTWIQEGLVVAASLTMTLSLQKRHSELLMALATEKSELLTKVQESETRYRLVSELVSDLAYVLDVKDQGGFRLEWTTDAFSNFFDTPLERVSQLKSILHPEDAEIVPVRIQQLLNGETTEDELRIIGKNNDIRWVRNYARPEWNQDHTRVARIFGAMQDITSEKLAEEKLQHRNEEISRLYRASETLFFSETPSTEKLAKKIVEAILKEFGKSNCSLFLIEQPASAKTPILKRIAVTGFYKNELDTDISEISGLGLVPKAIRIGETINEPDVSKNPAYAKNWVSARSELVIPLKVGESIIGAIDMQSTEMGAFSKDDERLVSIFAGRAASALENTRLLVQTQTRLHQLGALRNIDNAITGAFDLRPILQIFLEETVTQLSVDAASVLLLDRHMKTLQCVDRRGFQSGALQYSNLRLGEGYAGKAAMERRIIRVENIREEASEFYNSPLLFKENFIAYYGVPLIAKGEVKGVLEIFHRTPLEVDASWLTFLETLAGQAAIAIDNATMFDDLQRSNLELLQAYDATLEGWVAALDMRDNETKDHTQRVTEATLRLAQFIGVAGEKLLHIKRGGLLHDIGKISIPDRVLLKPGKLTEEEWEIMKQHPVYAQRFLSKVEYLRPALDIPYCHHEKWDGTGYPQGLKGQQIPLAARIFAVIDVWDALSSDRPYRKALPLNEVIEYIKAEKNKYFDPEIVDAFFELIEKQGWSSLFPQHKPDKSKDY